MPLLNFNPTLGTTSLGALLPIEYEVHTEVWILIITVFAVATYIAKGLAPKLGKAHTIKTRQKVAFGFGLLFLWIASDWPMHDISESYLYSIHMIQHTLITLVVPPLMWIATPEWLAKLVVGEKALEEKSWLRRLARPLLAGLIFNVFVAITHIPWVVNTSVDNGSFHYAIHFFVFTSAMIMWLPVCGPFPELRLRQPPKMAYLFAMSLIPTIPAAFLTFADRVIYTGYDVETRLWGISAVSDQQAAGLIMKVAAGMYLWGIIAFIFFKWTLALEKKHAQTVRKQNIERIREMQHRIPSGSPSMAPHGGGHSNGGAHQNGGPYQNDGAYSNGESSNGDGGTYHPEVHHN